MHFHFVVMPKIEKKNKIRMPHTKIAQYLSFQNMWEEKKIKYFVSVVPFCSIFKIAITLTEKKNKTNNNNNNNFFVVLFFLYFLFTDLTETNRNNNNKNHSRQIVTVSLLIINIKYKTINSNETNRISSTF